MQRVARMLQRTASLGILLIVCAGAAQAQAQHPQTTVVNDTGSQVTVTIVNPPFPPIAMSPIPAGRSNTFGSPRGSTLRIQDARTKQLVADIEVTQTRKVDLSAAVKSRPVNNLVTQPLVTQPPPEPSGRQMARGGGGQGTGGGASQNGEGTLHLIIASDKDDPDLGEGFEINEGLLRSHFIDSVASRSLRIYTPWGLEGDGSTKLTAKNLLAEVDKVRVKPNDTLMVYLACHGSWDRTTDEHWFRFENDSDSALVRKTLIERIKSRGTRLGLLITDACTNYDKLPANRIAVSPLGPPVEKTAPLDQALFFDQQGFLDLSSSSPGQFTLYYNNYKDWTAGDPLDIKSFHRTREIPGSDVQLQAYSMTLNGETMKGGLFTESMLALLKTNVDKKYDWNEFAGLLRDDVETRFDEENPDGQLAAGGGNIFQDAQTVSASEYPQPLGGSSSLAGPKPGTQTRPTPGSGPATNKFGVSVVAGPGGGVTVKIVRDGSPAARYGVKVGEVIEKINNQPVNTPDELEAALAKAPATFRVTIGGASFVVSP